MALLGVEANPTVHLLHQGTGDRQAQPGAPTLTSVGGVGLGEPLEYAGAEVFWNALPLVLNADLQAVAVATYIDTDDTASR